MIWKVTLLVYKQTSLQQAVYPRRLCYLSRMLHRRSEDGWIIISQPAHSWVSGQLARAWANEMFGDLFPKEETCLAAELHDIGFLDWEQSPTLNAKTGLPHSFLELPTKVHLDIWSKGIRQITLYSRYAALLVSMHFTGLAQRHPVLHPPSDVQLSRNFLDEQRSFQCAVVNSLRDDTNSARSLADEVIARNRALVSLWDWMSLLLCMGFGDRQTIEDVPAAGSKATLDLVLLNQNASSQVKVSPWPFREDLVHLVCEGRRLLKTFTDQEAMRAALRDAPAIAIEVDLVPGSSVPG